MKFGIWTVINTGGITYPELGRALEERGFESLLVPEHTHIPVTAGPRIDGNGDEMDPTWFRMPDPFVSLGAVAAVTARLKLILAVTLLVQREPIVFAKGAATLDELSGGRLIVGVGAGNVLDELQNHGVAPAERGKVLDERIDAVKAMWTQEKAEYHGDYVDFGPIYSWPKPVQRPHPPIYIGGWSKAAARRTVERGDGWLAPPLPADAMRAYTEDLRERAGHPVPVTVTYTPTDAGLIHAYEDLGVERIALILPTLSRDESLAELDKLAAFVSKY
ncbi:LLM class F420-dependent oxidoreductase [Amycolatopsis carbonis]|uniref:LLM class F420-dependent oxidoreductase n=1 Tax=Amycolatopsis carbonis TaxID=715471 RepID=A0A9Y2MUC0_9PSEU|nr:LLM class F420-dependent oxidoreductase [Amycolatopsis sp. 2-15]WIX81640.1 LLM class F420-dependent oxidoreductase [Amycolatopsis sp. 2-15]